MNAITVKNLTKTYGEHVAVDNLSFTVLKGSVFGRLFVRFYYAVSPGLVRRVGGRDFFRKPVKRVLDQFVIHLKNKGFQDTPYDDR